MHTPTNAARVRPALAALAVCAFAIGTTEFVIAGVLPGIAADMRVTIPTAGLLVSGYALGVVAGAPVVTALVAGRPPKPLLLGLLVVFEVGNTMSAAATGFGPLLAGRVVASLCHGAFLGVASIVAADLVDAAHRARAIAAMFTGLTVANLVGVPLGTLIGQHFGWRATFWAIVALGAVGMAGVARFVPSRPPPEHASAGWAVFRRAELWLALGMTAFGFGAVYAPFTYIAPTLVSVTGFAPADIGWLLMVFGAGLVVGNLLGARAADRRLMPTIAVLLPLLAAVLVAFAAVSHAEVATAVALFVLGVVAFALVPAFTIRVIAAAGGTHTTMASSAAVAAFNLGNAAGALLGGRAIAAGYGYPAASLVGAGMAAIGLLFLAGLAVRRRSAAAPHDQERRHGGARRVPEQHADRGGGYLLDRLPD